jgi:large subunit ribosomal protein L29
MKAADLLELNAEELAAKLKELNEELFKLRFQHSTNQLDNTGRLRGAKRDLARVKTVLKQKTGEKW